MVGALVVVASATAWTPKRAQLNERRHNVMHTLDAKCLNTWPLRPLPENMTRLQKAFKWSAWGNRKERAAQRSSRCGPQAIIRAVFPDSTEGAALSVAYCETGGTFNIYAHNASGASGLFQLMPFHWQGKFDPYNPWANSRYALQLSYGGTNWGAWVCKP